MEKKLMLKTLDHLHFTLHLNNVLYAPSLWRNLISIHLLYLDGFQYNFGDMEYLIKHNNHDVGLAYLQDKLYLLAKLFGQLILMLWAVAYMLSMFPTDFKISCHCYELSVPCYNYSVRHDIICPTTKTLFSCIHIENSWNISGENVE
jgi:hypothetical protein